MNKNYIKNITWFLVFVICIISGSFLGWSISEFTYEKAKNSVVKEYKEKMKEKDKKIQLLQNQDSDMFYNKDMLVKYIQYENYKTYDDLAKLIIKNVFKYAEKYEIDPFLIIAMMQVESDFSTDVKSSAGSIGLMQITPSVWIDDKDNKYSIKSLGITKRKQLYDPEINIKAGSYILSHYLKQCEKDVKCALKRYFGGNYDSYVDKIKYAVGEYYMYINSIK